MWSSFPLVVQPSPPTISRLLSSCKTDTLYPLSINASFFSLSPWHHHHTFCLCEFDCSRYLICKWNHAVLVISLNFMSSRIMSEFPLFKRLNNIPPYVYTASCLSIRLFMDTWAASKPLTVLSKAARNMSVQVPLSDSDFNSFSCIHRSGVDRAYGNTIFNILRNHLVKLFSMTEVIILFFFFFWI